MTTTQHPRATVFLGRVADRLQRYAARLFQGVKHSRAAAQPEAASSFLSAPDRARHQPMPLADSSPTDLIPTVPPVRPYVLDREHLQGRWQRGRHELEDRQRSGVAVLAGIAHRQQPLVGAVR